MYCNCKNQFYKNPSKRGGVRFLVENVTISRIFGILTPRNDHEFASRCVKKCNSWTVLAQKKLQILPRARFKTFFAILNYFNFGIIQNRSSMRYIKLNVNWDEELISRGQNRHGSVLFGALVARCYIVSHLAINFTCRMSIIR